jgi:hypothetical protein
MYGEGALIAVWDAGRMPSGVRNHCYVPATDNQGNLDVSCVGPDNNSDSNVQKLQIPTLE